MKKRIRWYVLFIFALFISFCSITCFQSSVNGEEIGQLETKAGVGFYEESTTSTTDSSTETTVETSSSTSIANWAQTWGGGKLPSTGEQFKLGFSLIGLLLLLFILLFYWKKRRSRKERSDQK